MEPWSYFKWQGTLTYPQKNDDPPSAMVHPCSPSGKAERNRRKKDASKKRKADAKLEETEEKRLLEGLSNMSVNATGEAESEATKCTEAKGRLNDKSSSAGMIRQSSPVEIEDEQTSGAYFICWHIIDIMFHSKWAMTGALKRLIHLEWIFRISRGERNTLNFSLYIGHYTTYILHSIRFLRPLIPVFV